MLPGETPQELDQRPKGMICKANMTLIDGQHRTRFVASLTLHLRIALSQQKLSTQVKALEITMRLHETPIQDPSLGVQQIHVQLKNLRLKMQSLKQDNITKTEACEEVWCIKCKGQGHDEDHCPVFVNYLVGGGSMPLRPKAQVEPSAAPTLWRLICKIGGKHTTNNYNLLQKYTQTSQWLFCNFCRLVGHDERTCRSYELMMDQTPTYRVQIEMQALDQNPVMMRTGFQGHGRGREGMGLRRGSQIDDLLQLHRAR